MKNFCNDWCTYIYKNPTYTETVTTEYKYEEDTIMGKVIMLTEIDEKIFANKLMNVYNKKIKEGFDVEVKYKPMFRPDGIMVYHALVLLYE